MEETAFDTKSERFTAACILSVTGGFLDIYTYLYRGRVFANAVTGNMVLFGLNLAEGEWTRSARYLLAIVSYAFGIFVAETVHRKLPTTRRLSWNHSVLALEFGCLLPVCFLPCGDWDFAVNAIITFVCALQVQTFRRVHGLPFASTMCTGNLRSGTEAVFHAIHLKDKSEFHKAMHYYGIIVCFIAGAVLGAVLLRTFGHLVLLLTPAGLAAVFVLITTRRQIVSWEALWRKIARKTSAFLFNPVQK